VTFTFRAKQNKTKQQQKKKLHNHLPPFSNSIHIHGLTCEIVGVIGGRRVGERLRNIGMSRPKVYKISLTKPHWSELALSKILHITTCPQILS
jgi:hypothetical protein